MIEGAALVEFAKSIRRATLEEAAMFVETHYCIMVPPYGPGCDYEVKSRPKHPNEPLAAAIRGLAKKEQAMTQTLYFITQNGQPISMETWTDREKAQVWCDALNNDAGQFKQGLEAAARFVENWSVRHLEFVPLGIAPGIRKLLPYEVRSRVSSANASEATPITATMGLPGATKEGT